MMNEPGFITTWMACSRLGVTAALLNFNLRTKSLLHCIDISEAKILIVGKDAQLIQVNSAVKYKLTEIGHCFK